jgi:hypothetical protein
LRATEGEPSRRSLAYGPFGELEGFSALGASPFERPTELEAWPPV